MSTDSNPKYYLVEASIIPDVFIKVTRAKRLLETGEAETIAEAVSMAGISRSAFYKYRNSISPFTDMTHGHIITFQVILQDKPGVLSTVISKFAELGLNILTINQSIPSNGTAAVTISAETLLMQNSIDALIGNINEVEGVLKTEILAG